MKTRNASSLFVNLARLFCYLLLFACSSAATGAAMRLDSALSLNRIDGDVTRLVATEHARDKCGTTEIRLAWLHFYYQFFVNNLNLNELTAIWHNQQGEFLLNKNNLS